jgi:serine/threonine protein kinase
MQSWQTGLSVLLTEGIITATTSNGSYRWSAPEVCVEGDVRRAPPSDIYSFGCVCLEVLYLSVNGMNSIANI